MNFDTIKSKVYFEDGSLRDIYVSDINKEDWRLWVEFVNKTYKTSHHTFETNLIENAIDFSKVLTYWNGGIGHCTTATVDIDGIQIKAHFFDDEELENDILPSEIRSFDDHNKLIKYMIEVSNLLDKTIILTPEGEKEEILISVYKNDVLLNL